MTHSLSSRHGAWGQEPDGRIPNAEDVDATALNLSMAQVSMLQMREDTLALWGEDWLGSIGTLHDYMGGGALLTPQQAADLQASIRHMVTRNAFGFAGNAPTDNPLLNLLDQVAYKAYSELGQLISLKDAAELRFGPGRANLMRLVREVDAGKYTVVFHPDISQARGGRLLLKEEVGVYDTPTK